MIDRTEVLNLGTFEVDFSDLLEALRKKGVPFLQKGTKAVFLWGSKIVLVSPGWDYKGTEVEMWCPDTPFLIEDSIRKEEEYRKEFASSFLC